MVKNKDFTKVLKTGGGGPTAPYSWWVYAYDKH